jgi:hypothetical protein
MHIYVNANIYTYIDELLEKYAPGKTINRGECGEIDMIVVDCVGYSETHNRMEKEKKGRGYIYICMYIYTHVYIYMYI